MAKIELADKLILHSRRLSAITLFISITVTLGTLFAFESKLDEDLSKHFIVFGVKMQLSLVPVFGPAIIIFFQFVTWRYLSMLSQSINSNGGIINEITEPWFVMQPGDLSLFGSFVYLFVPPFAVFFASFLHLDENKSLTLYFDKSVLIFLLVAISGIIAISSIYNISKTKKVDDDNEISPGI